MSNEQVFAVELKLGAGFKWLLSTRSKIIERFNQVVVEASFEVTKDDGVGLLLPLKGEYRSASRKFVVSEVLLK